MNKTKAILAYLEEHPEGITSAQAFNLFGATRLSALIFSLNKQGYRIVCDMEKGIDRYGDNVRFGRYRLWKEEKK
mgnify:CR=1 FL=1